MSEKKSLAVANNAAFRNCLISMRPKAVRQDIPSTHQVTTYIHNEFVKWLTEMKSDILVSLYQTPNTNTNILLFYQGTPGKILLTVDGWTADNTKASFLGMTAHWIDTKEGIWKLRSEVVGFKPISGDHSGWNLGRYIVGLCERIGIWNLDSDSSKVGSDRFISDKIS